MNNLHPKAPKSTDTDTFLGHPIEKVLHHLDALLLVLKSCAGEECRQPWTQLHPNGQIHSLLEALDEKFDDKYKGLPRVNYSKCFKDGTFLPKFEGPQWGEVNATALIEEG